MFRIKQQENLTFFFILFHVPLNSMKTEKYSKNPWKRIEILLSTTAHTKNKIKTTTMLIRIARTNELKCIVNLLRGWRRILNCFFFYNNKKHKKLVSITLHIRRLNVCETWKVRLFLHASRDCLPPDSHGSLYQKNII